MKHLYKTIISLSVLAFAASSCSLEDFLYREPIDEFDSSIYFSSEKELEMYANGMVNSWLPNYSEPAGGDAYNDLIATKTCTDFFRADVEWDSIRQGTWAASSWSFLRRVNYMLNNMGKAKGNVPDEIYDHYEGVARFWRAYVYASRIKTFSDVPWVETVLEKEDTAILYGPRQSREFVFQKITEDLEFACSHCLNNENNTSFKNDGRTIICRDIVESVASRIYLYEGTFRKNYPNNPATNTPWKTTDNGLAIDSPNDIIRKAQVHAKHVIDNGGYTLVDDYASLFVSDKLIPQEVIWGRTYLAEANGRHDLTKYFHSSTMGQQYSGTKDLVRMFLKTDGTPIDNAGAQVSITQEYKNRDKRLTATVLFPGRTITGMDGQPKFEDVDFTYCKTGYQIVKWSVPDESHFSSSIDENSLPCLRYPEVLLNYAEACEELGEMTEDIWNQTVGALRTRAGVTNIYPLSAAYVADPWLASYYSTGLLHPAVLSPVALEIRRERVTELTFEAGLRQDDVYRYAQGDLIARRYNNKGWAGIYVTTEEYNNKLKFNSEEYSFESAAGGAVNTTTCYPIKPEAAVVNTDWFLTEGNHGYLVYTYALKWEDKMYCRPIPMAAYSINPALGQNYGWN